MCSQLGLVKQAQKFFCTFFFPRDYSNKKKSYRPVVRVSGDIGCRKKKTVTKTKKVNFILAEKLVLVKKWRPN